MNSCPCTSDEGLCSRERESADPVSPGKVADSERICRGGYRPDNRKADGEPRDNIVREKDLYFGSLSVWRVGGPHEFRVADVVGVLKGVGPKDNELWRIFAPGVKAIRSTAGEGLRNEFCVVDDTDCGRNERHPAHAVIALCPTLGFSLRPFDEVKADIDFQELKTILIRLLRSNVVWQAET